MQSLYTLGVRQTTAIQADLERLRAGDHSVTLLGTLSFAQRPSSEDLLSKISLGQISASLASFNRTVDDYDSMAKREVIKLKQEKALMYAIFMHMHLRPHSISQPISLLHHDEVGGSRNFVQTTWTYGKNLNKLSCNRTTRLVF